ncbi:MAG: hypothetical protein KDI66_14440 [Xanthomonadales bacterium]|nr:hypothetical protein [Xanthomonadales bacterium]
MIKVIGAWRIAIAGAFLFLGAFFSVAMVNAEHFGWGFNFLDAAIVYALIWPLFVVVDTIIFVVLRMRSDVRAANSCENGFGVEVSYFLINWFLAGYYLFAMMG